MPYPYDLRKLALRDTLTRLQAASYTPVGELTVEAWVTDEPARFEARTSGQYKLLAKGEAWGSRLFDCAWMRFTGIVPEGVSGEDLVLRIDFNGEGLVVDAVGNPALGLTNFSSQFESHLGLPGKKVVPLRGKQAGEPIEVWVDAANNDLFGTVQKSGILEQAEIAVCHPQIKALSYDFEVLGELMHHLDPKSARSRRLRAKLHEASLGLHKYSEEEAILARSVLAPELARRGGDASLRISAVGHAHIDLAWLWPLRETIRKGARTFSTVLHMMERYPDYVFGASQPQLYAWMQEYYPHLYARIKTRIKEGRWEPQGAMWVEPDTNVPSGESMVRQILYGKRFFADEFGMEPNYLWEPDVFGYTAALPQILAKSGIRFFMTQKMSWNEINKFPHQTFWWEGIDGSRVLAHMLPEETYNSPATPRSVHQAEYNYLDSGVSSDCLLLFGIGDGGGGPGEEHLERLAREKNLEGLCPVTQEPAQSFFNRLAMGSDKYVTWQGELYLEKHQGTLTTQARSKRFNRKLEYLLREVELSAVWGVQSAPDFYGYPTAALDRIWKEVLLLQFHDILPGSSITRVYDESLARYAVLESELQGLLNEADAAWMRQASNQENSGDIFLVNSLSWPRTEWIKAGGQWRKITLPALSRSALDECAMPSEDATVSVQAGPRSLENELLRVDLAESGAVTAIYDKQAQREVLAHGAFGNRMSLYNDEGDAWDFAIDYALTPPAHPMLKICEPVQEGPEAILRCVYETAAGSIIRQDVVLTSGSGRIDFRTHVDWRESSTMLRTSFETDIRANDVVCDIQFGTLRRPITSNTTWDAAKHEIAAHKWVDLSEPGYGVALLNDCKYGHRIKGGVIDLNLLRSPHYPDPVADVAEHEFTYSLLPHLGDHIAGRVMCAGYELNVPIRVVQGERNGQKPNMEPSRQPSWIATDAPSIMIETVKKAQDDSSVIVRLYENSGARTTAALAFGFPVAAVELVDLMEQNGQPLTVTGNSLTLVFRPFEILTLKLG